MHAPMLWMSLTLCLGAEPTSGADPLAAARQMLASLRDALAQQADAALTAAPGSPAGAVDIDLVFALAALADSSRGEADAHAALLARGRGWLRERRGDDGSFLTPPSLEATWYSLVLFAGSTLPADQAARDAAQRFLLATATSLPGRAAPGGTPIDAAWTFLKTTAAGRGLSSSRPAAPGAGLDLDLGRHAGSRFDLRAARRFLHAEPLGSLTRELRLPSRGGAAQDLHLAARVLADLGSPRLVDENGKIHRWPEEYLQALTALAAEPSLAALAARVLAYSALEPWLVTLPERSLDDAARRETAAAAVLAADCVDCHDRLHPGIVHQWRQSQHAQSGVGCDACHGKNHSQIFRENGAVSPGVCGGCHARPTAEFATSRHATAEATLLNSALFAATPPSGRAGCRSCHAIGRSNPDGSTGSCNFCHSSHAASAAEAREPEACTGCHTGEDYPQDLAYRLSKHGAIYYRTRDARLAPTCVTCHQPGGDHGTSFGITVGGVGTGGHVWPEEAAVPMESISADRFAEERGAMIRVCVPCHSSRLARDALESADELKRDGNRRLLEARRLLRDLQASGLLGRDAGSPPLLGGRQVRVAPELPAGEALNRFYDMWRFHYAWTWKGAYHSSPSVSNLESRPGLDADLDVLRAAAARLREQKK